MSTLLNHITILVWLTDALAKHKMQGLCYYEKFSKCFQFIMKLWRDRFNYGVFLHFFWWHKCWEPNSFRAHWFYKTLLKISFLKAFLKISSFDVPQKKVLFHLWVQYLLSVPEQIVFCSVLWGFDETWCFRYLRFFPDGQAMMLTTPEDPLVVVPRLRSRNSRCVSCAWITHLWTWHF